MHEFEFQPGHSTTWKKKRNIFTHFLWPRWELTYLRRGVRTLLEKGLTDTLMLHSLFFAVVKFMPFVEEKGILEVSFRTKILHWQAHGLLRELQKTPFRYPTIIEFRVTFVDESEASVEVSTLEDSGVSRHSGDGFSWTDTELRYL